MIFIKENSGNRFNRHWTSLLSGGLDQGEIIGIPPSEWEYEFMVVKPREDGNFDWAANYENYPEKIEDGCIITHNVKIAHKQSKNI